MVEQRRDFQYSDDDLTIDRLDREPLDPSVVDLSEPLDPSVVDLFDYLDDDSSPTISRLKALVLSIDWEITDEVLRDFNEELASLRGIWGGDPIKVVYLQALEKISKYIYRAKSDAHPDAVKLLPMLFVDLEKIVQGGRQMSEEEKKELLSEDVRRFNRLKVQIQQRHPGQLAVTHKPARAVRSPIGDVTDGDGVMAINRLKALILGIDWEITEKDLMALRREVLHLEDIFARSRPKQLFLQGIGTLTAYIRNKKSNAHADAFVLLHDFFAGLEKVVAERLDFPAEKAVLLPLVARFNTFKETIATTLSAEAIAKSKQAVFEEEAKEEDEAGPLQPAFADLPDNVHGFRLEEEALSPDVPQAVTADIEKFFIEEDGPPLASIVDESEVRDPAGASDNLFGHPAADPVTVAPEVALRGINVETEADDDSEEAALPRQGGQLAPALSDEPALPYGETDEKSQAFLAESEVPEEISSRLDDFFSTPAPPPPSALVSSPMAATKSAAYAVPPDIALQGVDVGSETDDDERDEPAPAFLADVAPALADIDAPEELAFDEGGEEVEFAVAGETTPALAFLPDDEPEGPEYAESAEIAPALSGFDDAELPERSEFSADGARDEAVLSLENEELLAFFGDTSPDGEKEALLAPTAEEQPEARVVDEVELLEVSPPPDDERLDDLITFLAEDEAPAGPADMPSALSKTEDMGEMEGDIAFLSDDVSAPAEAAPVADANIEPTLSLSDETELFVDDFFAGQTDDVTLATAAESATERDSAEIPGVDIDDESNPVAGQDFSGIPGVDIDDESSPVAALFDAEVPEEEPSEPVFPEEDISLRDCVNALSDEINDDILDQSYREVRRLRGELGQHPLAGIYLQFISTIMQHIDQRRADANEQALPLLRQTLDHLEDSRRDGQTEKVTQSLLDDTQAVLSWQQGLLHERGPAARLWL